MKSPNEVRPLDRLITGFASSCGYEIQTVFNDLLRFIIHGFSPGAPPISNWKYKRQQNASFMEMTAEWTRIMQKQIGRSGWFDAFGELHMAYCSNRDSRQTDNSSRRHISVNSWSCARQVKKRPDRGWETPHAAAEDSCWHTMRTIRETIWSEKTSAGPVA
mgnify:CR=1 FL=1